MPKIAAPTTLVLLVWLVATARGQTLDEKALGGPCSASESPGWSDLNNRQTQAAEAKDYVLAADLARQVVRGDCTNEYWWLRLAESLVQANKPGEAITVLEAAYARQFNEIERRLRTDKPTLIEGSPLKDLTQTELWRQSAFAVQIDEDRRNRELRQKAARSLMATVPRPPENYIVRNACPGEGCHFGSATALKQVDLFERPGAARSTGRIERGDIVRILTGEEHLRPQPVLVRQDFPLQIPAKAGTVVYLLNYAGEGDGRVWINDKVHTGFWGVADQCTFPNERCWGEFIEPADSDRMEEGMWGSKWSVWWIQVRAATGKVGWARAKGNFEVN